MIRVWAIEPVSAPRQVRSHAWKPTPHVLRYRAYREWLQWHQIAIPEPFHHAIFVLPMPKSWSAVERTAQAGMPHLSKPDRDNLEKALLDSAFSEDKQVWDGRATKLWGQRGLVMVSAQPIAIVCPFDLEPIYRLVERSGPVVTYAPSSI